MFEIRNPKRDTNRMCTIKTYFYSIQMYLYNISKTEPSKQVAAEVAVRGGGGIPSANLRRLFILSTELRMNVTAIESDRFPSHQIPLRGNKTIYPVHVCCSRRIGLSPRKNVFLVLIPVCLNYYSTGSNRWTPCYCIDSAQEYKAK